MPMIHLTDPSHKVAVCRHFLAQWLRELKLQLIDAALLEDSHALAIRQDFNRH